MRLWLIAAVFALSACSGERAATPTYHSEENPERLSDWGMLDVRNGVLSVHKNVTPYDLATPLFSDYALKLRTVWLPDGTTALYQNDNAFDFPIGTVITKTFYYTQEGRDWNGAVLQNGEHRLSNGLMALSGARLVETRILVHREDGWVALPYVWNDEQTDATLKRIGDIKPLTLVREDGRREAFSYVVPNANQCAGCHATDATTKAIKPIGPRARHLNKTSTFHPEFNQLDYWVATGLLGGDLPTAGAPRNALWGDMSQSLDHRARSYLDANCSHCHNPDGAADTSGLDLEPGAAGPALGVCKNPIAAGGGSGGRRFDIIPGAPEQSITVFRMETNDPGAMMPELGRSVAHEEGVALVAEWIAAMEGDCDA